MPQLVSVMPDLNLDDNNTYALAKLTKLTSAGKPIVLLAPNNTPAFLELTATDRARFRSHLASRNQFLSVRISHYDNERNQHVILTDMKHGALRFRIHKHATASQTLFAKNSVNKKNDADQLVNTSPLEQTSEGKQPALKHFFTM